MFNQIKIVYYRKMFWAKQQLRLKISFRFRMDLCPRKPNQAMKFLIKYKAHWQVPARSNFIAGSEFQLHLTPKGENKTKAAFF